MRYHALLPLAILLSVVPFLPHVACGGSTASRPAARPTPAPVVPGASLTPRMLRHVVARQVVNNPNVARLIPRQPVLGGTWLVASESDVRYVAPGVVAIDYEDGHIAGRLVVRVVDANDPRTWVVLRDWER